MGSSGRRVMLLSRPADYGGNEASDAGAGQETGYLPFTDKGAWLTEKLFMLLPIPKIIRVA